MKLKQKTDQTGFAHILIFLFLFIFIVIVGAGLYVYKTNARTSGLHKTRDLAFITSSPVDLSQINNFSKFRSCSGHDYSGTNVDGIAESMRSMKNYAAPDSSFSDTKDKIKVYAPFDGSIAFVGASKGRGVGLGLKPEVANGWVFEFGHIQPLSSIGKGSTVKSGQLIGYADVSQGAGAFDLQLYYPKVINIGFSGLDSFMNHLTPTVTANFADYGFTKENMIISKTTRDAAPCKASEKKDNGDAVFISDLVNDITTTVKPLSPAQKPATNTNASNNGKPSSPSAAGVSGECAQSIPADQRPPGCR